MAKSERWAFWFVIGFVGAIVFWGWVASTFGPHDVNRQIPMRSMPHYIRESVCGWGNHPTAAVETSGGTAPNLYLVTCSDGIKVTIGW